MCETREHRNQKGESRAMKEVVIRRGHHENQLNAIIGVDLL